MKSCTEAPKLNDSGWVTATPPPHLTYTSFRNRLDSSLHVDGANYTSGVCTLISVMKGEIERGTFRIRS